ncbi:hypothetical protein CKQ84_14155 [Shewanella sp. WE21]|uniref:hypothetical protein n=1 Tax=Shewanella sp. WE21 TaxID=2029986 RepID=UPI000CF71E61|nr:hypothetical protein [Shewanella sp. WE21]AVI66931.1 hypothetical protein CKQ84_14155 [Shewanella sp. WE21]
MSFVVFHQNPVDGAVSLLTLASEDEASNINNKMQAHGRRAFFAASGDDIFLDDDSRPMHCLTVDFDKQTWQWDIEKYHQEILLEKLSLLATETDATFSPVLNTYSQAEMQSWMAQETEAIAWIADNNSPTPTLDALNPRESKEHFCHLVIRKAVAFKDMLKVVGISQRLRDDLSAMTYQELSTAQPQVMLRLAILEATTQGAST